MQWHQTISPRRRLKEYAVAEKNHGYNVLGCEGQYSSEQPSNGDNSEL
jgi:hypothetical protein